MSVLYILCVCVCVCVLLLHTIDNICTDTILNHNNVYYIGITDINKHFNTKYEICHSRFPFGRLVGPNIMCALALAPELLYGVGRARVRREQEPGQNVTAVATHLHRRPRAVTHHLRRQKVCVSAMDIPDPDPDPNPNP